MSDPVFLVDVRRGDEFLRFATGSVAEVQQILRAQGVDEDLEYLRVERVLALPAAQKAAASR